MIVASFALAMPFTSKRRSGSFSKTSMVFVPNLATIAFAVSGPIPLMRPEQR